MGISIEGGKTANEYDGIPPIGVLKGNNYAKERGTEESHRRKSNLKGPKFEYAPLAIEAIHKKGRWIQHRNATQYPNPKHEKKTKKNKNKKFNSLTSKIFFFLASLSSTNTLLHVASAKSPSCFSSFSRFDNVRVYSKV